MARETRDIDGFFGAHREVFVLVADLVVERGAAAEGAGLDGARGDAGAGGAGSSGFCG